MAERRSFRKVSQGKDAIAFFDFSFEPSEWWSGRAAIIGYISGIVVAGASRGFGVGSFILGWVEARVRDHGARYLRLDCHAENDCSARITGQKDLLRWPALNSNRAISVFSIKSSLFLNHVKVELTCRLRSV